MVTRLDGRFDGWATGYERGPLQPRLCRSVHQALLARLGECRLAAGRVLDIGCGTGMLAAALGRRYPMAAVVGLDPARRMIGQAGARRSALRLACGRAEALPFADGVFDVVTSSLVWRHLADPAAAVRECRRVLAPGGVLVVADAFATRTRQLGRRPMVPAADRLCRSLAAAGLPVLHSETVAGFGPVAETTVVIAGRPYPVRSARRDARPALVPAVDDVEPVPVATTYRSAAHDAAATMPTMWPGTARW